MRRFTDNQRQEEAPKLVDVIRHTVLVTSLVLIMMLLIETVQVRTRGLWSRNLLSAGWRQYLVAVLLGISPGCAGAFAVVGLYLHRTVTLGALVACMVATAGDEEYVMYALVPKSALLLQALLAVLGIAAGWITDLVAVRYAREPLDCSGLVLHEEEVRVDSAGSWRECLALWRPLSWKRSVLAGGLGLLLVALLCGAMGPEPGSVLGLMIVAGIGFALWIAVTTSRHFFEEHLWKHVVSEHVIRIFGWTLASLTLLHLLDGYVDLKPMLSGGKWVLLGVACLVGLIPESGPHLIFVTLYAKGDAPFGVLLASSVVQDGHGMLPLLAHSRWVFILVKAIKLVLGLVVGAVALHFGS